MIIGNGLNTDTVPLRQKSTSAASKEYNFTCVAELSPPHGIDRLLKGLQQYKGDYIIKLNIVGRGSELNNLQKLAAQLELQNVVFHGFLSGKALDAVFEDTDLAIGALAMGAAIGAFGYQAAFLGCAAGIVVLTLWLARFMRRTTQQADGGDGLVAKRSRQAP